MNCMKPGHQYVRKSLKCASTCGNRAPLLPSTHTSMETSPSLFLNSCSSPSSFFCSSVRTSRSSAAGSGSGASYNTTYVWASRIVSSGPALNRSIQMWSRDTSILKGPVFATYFYEILHTQYIYIYNNNMHIYYGGVVVVWSCTFTINVTSVWLGNTLLLQFDI